MNIDIKKHRKAKTRWMACLWDNCGKMFQTTSNQAKYCPECRPLPRKAKNLQAWLKEKANRPPKESRPVDIFPKRIPYFGQPVKSMVDVQRASPDRAAKIINKILQGRAFYTTINPEGEQCL